MENGGLMNKRILLVEDNEATVEVVQKELEMLGYEVIVAKNGLQAVEMAGSVLPDLIVMDVLMPKMDGLQAASEIKDNPKTRAIPILAATAKAVSGDRERCLANGCDSYLAKPFTHLQLDAAIKRLLKEFPDRS
jgi:two-component system, cell cycle response regulator DivK